MGILTLTGWVALPHNVPASHRLTPHNIPRDRNTCRATGLGANPPVGAQGVPLPSGRGEDLRVVLHETSNALSHRGRHDALPSSLAVPLRSLEQVPNFYLSEEQTSELPRSAHRAEWVGVGWVVMHLEPSISRSPGVMTQSHVAKMMVILQEL